MAELHFDEDQLGNLQDIGAVLFSEDASDPRSWNYQRKLVRPTIHWARILMFTALLFFGAWGIYCLLTAVLVPSKIALWVCVVLVLMTLALCLKRILIGLVQIYQRFAPVSIRNRCRFEPSCSQYMILSLQKYGLWKGLKKGINRIRRCNANDGGFDYP